jgi:cell division protein FtsB
MMTDIADSLSAIASDMPTATHRNIVEHAAEELASLRAELLRVTELETAIEVRDEDCDRLRAENAELRARVAELEEQYSIRWPQLRELDAARKEEQK